MGVMKNSGPDPTITDKTNPRFTELSEYGKYPFISMMISDTSDVYYNNGYKFLEIVAPITEHEQVIGIKPGDFAVIGQRAGMITNVTTTTVDGKTKVQAIEINEDMRYLPDSWKDQAKKFGYDDDQSKRNRTVVYILDPEYKYTGSKQNIRNGSGAVFLYSGTLMIFRQCTDDKSTWNRIGQAAAEYQAKFDSP